MNNSKKLALAAMAGLFTLGSLGASATEDGGDGAHSCSAAGCDQKKESHSCEGKSSCEGKDGAESEHDGVEGEHGAEGEHSTEE